MHRAGAALIGAAIVAGLVVGLALFQPEIGPAREFEVSTGLAYLRLEPAKVINDPVLGNGTLLTYIAEVVVANEEDTTLVLKTYELALPAEVYVASSNCSGSTVTVTMTVTRPGNEETETVSCLTPLGVPPNERVGLGGTYLSSGDLLLGRESFRVAEPSSSFYIPPGYELHFVVSGTVFLPEPADSSMWETIEKGWVLALISVTGQGYGARGSFHDTVVINATLVKGPDSALYYLGPYDHVIADQPEETGIFPRS